MLIGLSKWFILIEQIVWKIKPLQWDQKISIKIVVLNDCNCKGKKIMEHSYRFFENKDCEYFPCHKGLEGFNCLFCYCPLYVKENCPGKPTYKEINGKRIKVCMDCAFPHRPDNYDAVIKQLKNSNI